MKKIILTLLSLTIYLISCGADCLPCYDDSGNLGIPIEYWEVFECAGYDKYIRNYVHCTYFQNEVIRNGNSYGGWADFNCDDIYIRNYENIYSQYRTIIHETAHLEYHTEDESYPLSKEKEFKEAMIKNNCYDF